MSGRYEPRGVLGRGGMAEVGLCQDLTLDRPVAVKRLLSELQDNEQAQRRFEREIRVQARLDHPAIVPVFDAGMDERGRRFFTMRKIGGRTLSAAVRALLRIEDPEARRAERTRLLTAYLRACLAVDYAHSRGVIHRDLKPGNLMLGRFGEVYVLDWGIAKVEGQTESALWPELDPSDAPQTRGPLGTPGYMSPEQGANPTQVTAAADVFALGRLLGVILTGVSPTREVRLPSLLNPEVPAEYDAVVARATHPDPDERYPTARALHDAVEAILNGDRDRALRRQLASDHIEAAREAQREGRFSDALREAGRALSLDPSNGDAAGLMSSLLLAPADQDPPELLEERDALDAKDARTAMHANALITLVILAIVAALMLSMDILRPGVLVLGSIPPALGAAVLGFSPPGHKATLAAMARSTVVAIGFAVPIAFSTLAYGPWVIPPMITSAVCILVASMVSIGWRRYYVAGWAIAALIGSLAVGTGLWGPEIQGDSFTWQAQMLGLDPVVTPLGIGIMAVALIVLSAFVVSRNTDRLNASRHEVHRIQWRLRQLAAFREEEDAAPSGLSPDRFEQPTVASGEGSSAA